MRVITEGWLSGNERKNAIEEGLTTLFLKVSESKNTKKVPESELYIQGM